MSETQDEKNKIRKRMIKKRNMILLSEIYRKSKMIQYNVINSPQFASGKTLGIYYPFGSEVRTEGIIDAALKLNKTVALPSIESGEIRFYALDDKPFNEHIMTRGKFGLKQPKIIGRELSFLDLLVIPGVAFDNKGYRIGYGGGYFDRLIVQRKFSFSLGLGYRLQLLDSDIPRLDFDQKIDGLVTEEGIIYF